MRLGELEVTPFVASRFRLDGGSMFGVVPKVLWRERAPADELNRIELSVNSLLVRAGEKNLLVEPGLGSKHDDRKRSVYAQERTDAVAGLRGLGVEADEIDVVVPTHLHLDHAGGATTAGEAGAVHESFPGAWYVVQEPEWEAAVDPGPLERASYNPADYEVLAGSGRLSLVLGTTEIAPGVRVELTGGHSRGHQVVRMRSEGQEALYLGDIVPTCAHLKLRWLMAWDLDPQHTYERKEWLLTDAAERGVTCFFAHDPRIAGGRVRAAGRGSFEVIEDTVIEPF
jgi:glyoxylase-like metal-dependent hydrolase (beta-lactamase superfamily II)